MNGITIQEINIVISLVASVTSLVVAIVAWRRRHVLGASWFGGLVLAVGWTSLWYAFEAAIGYDVNAYVTFSKFEYIGITFIPLFWLGFARAISGKYPPLARPLLILLMIFPVVTIGLAFTNQWHKLIWQEPYFETGSYGPIFRSTYGWGFWLFILYSYLLFLWGSLTLVRYAFRTWQVYRVQAILFLIGTTLPWVSNVLDIFDELSPIPELNLIAVFLSASTLALAFGLFRLKLLDLMPLAYDTILDNVPVGFIVTDIHNRIVAINRYIKSYLDDPASNPIGKPLTSAFSSVAEHMIAVRQESRQDQWRIQDRTFETIILPITDQKGTKRGYTFILSDITEQLNVQESLRQKQQQLDAFFSQALDGFFFMMLDEPILWDDTQDKEALLDYAFSHHRITRVNAAMRDQYRATPKDELIGMTPADFFARDLEYGRRVWRQFFDQGWLHIETTELRLDGTPMWIEGYFTCLYDEGGRITGHFGVQRDVTEHKQAEQQTFELALEQERVQILADFIKDSSHEFKTPLSIININAYLIEKTQDSAKRQEATAQITRQVERINQLVDALVTMSSLDSGIAPLFQPVDVNRLLRTSADVLSARFHNKRLTLDLELAGTLPMIPAHSEYLLQAFNQVIDNAIQHSPPGEKIVIRSTLHDIEWVAVDVCDTGGGIPNEALPLIFKRFYRLDSSHSTPGLGLGLPIAKKIIELHGGSISIHSEPGDGTRVQIYLPINATNRSTFPSDLQT